MEKVAEWLNYSCLTLNVEKTVAMFFSIRQNIQSCPEKLEPLINLNTLL